jgi:hypothetical protein
MRLGVRAGGRAAEAATTRESARAITTSAQRLGHHVRIIEVPADGGLALQRGLSTIDVAFPLIAAITPSKAG